MLSENDFKNNFGERLHQLRRKNKMTQSELADKLNYSDKAISKWERGESVPDSYTVYKIADFFSVSMDDIFSGKKEIHINETKADIKSKVSKLFVPLISVVGVLFLASLFFLVMKNVPVWSEYAHYPFIYAIPVIAIVLTVFSSLWWQIIYRFISVSLIIWSCGFAIYYSFNLENLKYIFVSCAVLQVVCIMAFLFAYFVIKKK